MDTNSAAETVAAVLDAVGSVISQTSAQFYSQLARATAAANSSTTMEPATRLDIVATDPVTRYSIPATYKFSVNDVRNLYGKETEAVADELITKFDAFLEVHFPGLKAYVELAESWLDAALRDGGSGINSDVEGAIWSRERERILKDSYRATDEAATQWAAKGFVIPPGALIHQMAVIDREAQEKIGAASRERAIKTWEVELENVKLAMNMSLTLRSSSIQASMEYMKAMVMGAAQQGMAVTQQAQAAHQKLNDVLLEFYKTDVTGKDFNLRYRTTDETFAEHVRKANFDSDEAGRQLKVNAAVAALQGLSSQAASALNGLHAQGSASDSMQTSVSA